MLESLTSEDISGSKLNVDRNLRKSIFLLETNDDLVVYQKKKKDQLNL